MKKTNIATVALSMILSMSLYANIRMLSSINKLKVESRTLHDKITSMSTSEESDKVRFLQLEKEVQSDGAEASKLQNDIASFALQARLCAQHHSTN